jgi:16S rRNA (uracil1498-N3)-methyltransferase
MQLECVPVFLYHRTGRASGEAVPDSKDASLGLTPRSRGRNARTTMTTHSFHVPECILETGATVVIGGDQAHHAVRVLRLAAGATVQLRNGRGVAAVADVTDTLKDRRSGEWIIQAQVRSLSETPRPSPAVHVMAACPKGDRLSEMVEGLSQVGAASFTPLLTQFTVVDPREGKVDRLRRIASESLKQCARLWVMDVHEPLTLEQAIAQCASQGLQVFVADASGRAPGRVERDAALFVGPEGGWSEQERARFAEAAFETVRFGPHVMRIETAAVVGAAMLQPI